MHEKDDFRNNFVGYSDPILPGGLFLALHMRRGCLKNHEISVFFVVFSLNSASPRLIWVAWKRPPPAEYPMKLLRKNENGAKTEGGVSVVARFGREVGRPDEVGRIF